MPRVPEEVLARLKREVSIERLVEASGVQLQKRGADLVGLCPFHDDTEPSLVVSLAKNLWHCLGACGAGGSVIDWVMKAQGVSFRHAVELLREGLPPSAAGGRGEPPPKVSTVRRLDCPVSAEVSEGELLGQVAAYYHGVLQGSPDALGYLEQRGLRDEEAIERFQLGFADRTLGLRLPAKTRKPGKEIRERLTKAGVFRESGHEHLAGSLVVPIPGPGGEVVNLYGRKIRHDLRKDVPRHLYLPGPHRGIWNREGLALSPELILCESLLDALTFWCAGFHHVTTSYGVQGFTRELFEALLGHGIERVLIAYDRDQAGDQAAEALAKKLAAEGIGCFRVVFPRGMDANAYALKVTPARESLGLALRSAEWMAGPTARATSSPAVRPPAAEETTSPAAERQPAPAAEPPEAPAEGKLILFADDSPAATSPMPPEAPAAPAAPVPAAPVVAAGGEEPELPAPGEPIELTLGDRHYRVRGLEKNLSYERLQVLVRVARGEAFFVDSVDLVSARKRGLFLKQAAVELGVKEEVVKKDLARLHFRLEALQDALIRRELAPKEPQKKVLTPEEERQALAFLRDPRLLERIVEDLEACGLVGEATNKLAAYLAAVSRKLEKPLAVMVQSTSAAGKSSLVEAVLALMPEEETIAYSAMTGQSLFYMGEKDLRHKIVFIAEEEGAERASYALKQLLSEGQLSIASTGKDPQSGRLLTHEYHVEGPVALFSTTTSIELDEELLNRCLVLTVDEGREQTRAIHRRQREEETLEGQLALRRKRQLQALHQNAQRLLRPLMVVNRYARELTFLDDRARTRRDHRKYLMLIRAVALLRQYQRPAERVEVEGREVEYVAVTPDDVAVANRLAHEVLGRSLDELPPQTRRFLDQLHAWVEEQCEERDVEPQDLRFSRREIREATGASYAQVRKHLARLVELEYVLVHRGGRGQSFVYELLWDGKGRDGEAFLVGLLDAEALARREAAATGTLTPSGEGLTPSEADLAPCLSPHLPPIDPGLHPREERLKSPDGNTSGKKSGPAAENALPGKHSSGRSYRQGAVVPVAARGAER